jgi:hypothetical protein
MRVPHDVFRLWFQTESKTSDWLSIVLKRTLTPSQPGSWLLSVMRTPIALPPSSDGQERAMNTWRRFKQTKSLQAKSLQERLRSFANDVRAGAEATSRLDEWVNSPGLQSPK